jgi:aminoglycoside phosphotransferase (APT) family kinase protein
VLVLRRNVTSVEIDLLVHLAGQLPVPDVVRTGADWIVYQYAEGITFQELKKTGSPDEIAQAAYAMGQALAKIQTVSVRVAPKLVGPVPTTPLLQQRLGRAEAARFLDAIEPWMPRILELNDERLLVHGDFNNRNTILKRENGRWVVASVLDWETAFAGSPLWDVARFTCYEDPLRPRSEPWFSDGYRAGGGKLPDDWSRFSRAISAFSAADALCRTDLPEQFVEELCALVTGFSLYSAKPNAMMFPPAATPIISLPSN